MRGFFVCFFFNLSNQLCFVIFIITKAYVLFCFLAKSISKESFTYKYSEY